MLHISYNIYPESMKHPSKIHQQSIQNHSNNHLKIIKISSKLNPKGHARTTQNGLPMVVPSPFWRLFSDTNLKK